MNHILATTNIIDISLRIPGMKSHPSFPMLLVAPHEKSSPKSLTITSLSVSLDLNTRPKRQRTTTRARERVPMKTKFDHSHKQSSRRRSLRGYVIFRKVNKWDTGSLEILRQDLYLLFVNCSVYRLLDGHV